MEKTKIIDTHSDEYDTLFDVVRIARDEAFDACVEYVEKMPRIEENPNGLREFFVNFRWLMKVEELRRVVERAGEGNT
jgi:hypothetical protein